MRTVALVAIFCGLARAQVTQHVTDLSIFDHLAPCASAAVSLHVASVRQSTELACGTAAPELQSCICSQSEVLSQVVQNVSSAVSSRCGEDAAADQSSASRVLEKYCSPGETITFSTPTTNRVTQYITDLEKMTFLAPCASNGLSWAVLYSVQSLASSQRVREVSADGLQGSTHCPRSASLYAPCVCSKPDVVKLVQSDLSSRILDRCNNREDVARAAELYSEYCAMTNGTTTFAPLDNAPGDMTYHVTALSQYLSLPKCAQSAVSSAVLDQTSWDCARGPQAIASCVCIKENMLHSVYERMTGRVAVNCGYSDKEPVYSAVDVLNYYCSAAEGKVVADITDTATESYPTASHGEGSGSGGAQQTGGSGNTDDDGGEGGSAMSPGTIAGAVIGAVLGVAIIIGAIFWFVRRRRTAAVGAAGAVGVETPENYTKPELDGTAKPVPVWEVGDTSGTGPVFTSAELQGTTVSPQQQPGQSPPAELSGSPWPDTRPPADSRV